MSSKLTEIETNLLASQFRKNEDARRILEKEPSRLWPATLASLPLLAQALFPSQVSAMVGLPASSTWFVVFTFTYAIFLSGEVAILRRQVKALHQLHNSDA